MVNSLTKSDCLVCQIGLPSFYSSNSAASFIKLQNRLFTHPLLYVTSRDFQMELSSQIKDLIHEYEGLFKSPDELPPSRTFDHSISLLSSAVHVNCRPYRYPPHQKDEIKRQVAKMFQAGLIIPSVSSFASLVLLVKKKDVSWRFCVDYRKLNDMTIKNKFQCQ
jgi:hypothetical protein